MRKSLTQPHILFWSFIPVLHLMGIWGLDENIFFQFESTFIDFSYWWVCFIGSILFFCFGLWYWLCKRFKLKLSSLLSLIHGWGSGITSIVLLYYMGSLSKNQLSFRYHENVNPDEFILGLLILFVLSQLAMVVNGILLLIRRIKLML